MNDDDTFIRANITSPRNITVGDLSTMRFDTFHNALRILHSIDGTEFDWAAAAFCEDGASLTQPGAWQRFQSDPVRFFLRADDQSAKAIWRLIERRQPPAVVESPQPPPEPKAAPADDEAFRRAYAESDGDHRTHVENAARGIFHRTV